MKKILPLGKLSYPFLEKLTKKFQNHSDFRVILGPKVGEDAAVIDYPDRYLVAKTDPITFATAEIGWYAVQVNANDIVTRAAIPKWFQATILLPEKKTTQDLVEQIFTQIYDACNKLNITVIGGHTEISYKLDRPIVVGCMLGEVEKDKLVLSSGAREGDVILLTKGIAIEGTAVIAREQADELKKKGYRDDFIKKCQRYLYNPGLSVVNDALLASKIGVHAMHDPTEGGLSAGLFEIAKASQVGLLIDNGKIPLLKESKILCEEYQLDPLKTIASGALLLVVPPKNADKIRTLLNKHGIKSHLIGEIKPKKFGIKIIEDGILRNLKYSARDEISKVF